MKSSGHRAIACVCGVACALVVVTGDALAASRESQRVKPLFQNSFVEQPVFARPGKARPHVFIRPRVEPPQREKLVKVREARVRPVFGTAPISNPDTVDVFRRPQRERMGGFPRGDILPFPHHVVPGRGNNLQAYRLGTRARVREHVRSHYMYYFRNHKERKPDDER